MVKKDKAKLDIGEQSKDKYNMWSGNGTDFLKMCGDSQMKICNSWVESMEELSKKAKNISSEAVPEKYKEFYDLWTKVYEKAFDNFFEDKANIR